MFRCSAPGTAHPVHRSCDQFHSRVPLAAVIQRRCSDHRLHHDVPLAPQGPVPTSVDPETYNVVLSERECVRPGVRFSNLLEIPLKISKGLSETTNCRHNKNGTSTVKMMNIGSQDLACGQTYQAHIVANNKVGSSTPSVVVTAKTKGGRPGVPKKSLFLKPNSTYLRLNLEAWPDNDCPIDRFVVRHRPMLQPHWTTSECIIFIYNNIYGLSLLYN